jgi:hypothetical protein
VYVPAASAGIVNVVRATPVITADAAIGAAETLDPTLTPCGMLASSLRNDTTAGFPAAMVIVAGEKTKSRALTSTSPLADGDGDPDGDGDAPGDVTGRSTAHRENPVALTWAMSAFAAFMRFTAVRFTATVRLTVPEALDRVAGSVAATEPGFAHVPARTVTVTGARRGRAFRRIVTLPVPAAMATTVTVPLAALAPTDPRQERSTEADAAGPTATRRIPAAARRAVAAAAARPGRAPAAGDPARGVV